VFHDWQASSDLHGDIGTWMMVCNWTGADDRWQSGASIVQPDTKLAILAEFDGCSSG